MTTKARRTARTQVLLCQMTPVAAFPFLRPVHAHASGCVQSGLGVALGRAVHEDKRCQACRPCKWYNTHTDTWLIYAASKVPSGSLMLEGPLSGVVALSSVGLERTW